MHRQLHQLNSRIIPFLKLEPRGHRHLREAERSRIRVLPRADDLEGRDHGETHVLGSAVGAVGADAQVDVDKRCRVALEPAWLEGNGAACCGPVGPVLGEVEAAACF